MPSVMAMRQQPQYRARSPQKKFLSEGRCMAHPSEVAQSGQSDRSACADRCCHAHCRSQKLAPLQRQHAAACPAAAATRSALLSLAPRSQRLSASRRSSLASMTATWPAAAAFTSAGPRNSASAGSESSASRRRTRSRSPSFAASVSGLHPRSGGHMGDYDAATGATLKPKLCCRAAKPYTAQSGQPEESRSG